MIQEYQARIFCVKHFENDDKQKVENEFLKKAIYNENESTYIYSIFEEKLEKQYEFVRKLAYTNDSE